MPWGHTNFRVQGSEPEGFSHDHHQKRPAVQVASHGKRSPLGLFLKLPLEPKLSPSQPVQRKSTYLPRTQEQKTLQGPGGLSSDGDLRLNWVMKPRPVIPTGQGSKGKPPGFHLPTFPQQVQQKQERLKSKVFPFWEHANSVQSGKTGPAVPKTETRATNERENSQWSTGWGTKNFSSPGLGELHPTKPKISWEPKEANSTSHLQHSSSLPFLRGSTSGTGRDSPCYCSICFPSPVFGNLVKVVPMKKTPVNTPTANQNTSTMAKNSQVPKNNNKQTVKLKSALITSCSDGTPGSQRRFHPFRVRFEDESPKDMALRYWERNYEVQKSLHKSTVACQSPEQMPGKPGIWMDGVSRSGPQQTNLWQDESLCDTRRNILPTSFQGLSADNLKKTTNYSAVFSSPLATVDFSDTKPFQDLITDHPKKSSTCSNPYSSPLSSIDFSGTSPIQDLPADTMKKNPTYSAVCTSSPLAGLDFPDTKPLKDLSSDLSTHTSLFSSPATTIDRSKSRSFNNRTTPARENSPSLWVPRMDSYGPHWKLSNSWRGGQPTVYPIFPSLTQIRAQRSESPKHNSPEPPKQTISPSGS
ncbi:uncharacterized protein C9orf50 homolog isoform X1 [Monodelphis domestica]|uniref:uncharacterized protein C9orf50 homolog isoform X1 n=2 Tax=Monodelphis domestica TaxID=13616 RepID=UPI0024E1B001|nr:uncharacterized protein C9orf50 homolog isoform X1 [Monodelphis domestica]XP_016283138.2 uncharacterized protein C9orf50 homolog isoform X1 [Monodelphis domestica]